MSTLMTQARTRVPRFAEAAVERARLSVVPARAAGAPRAPFVTLVLLLLAGGVVGLLMFNTNMQQSSFYATALQQQASALSDKKQGLDMELEQLRSPQQLATSAHDLGMVAPPQPAFVRISDGKVLGQPLAASAADRMRIVPFPPAKPAALNPSPLVITVPATQTLSTKAAQKAAAKAAKAAKRTHARHASATSNGAGGKKKAAAGSTTSTQGATR
jgi:hypothetical protein